MRPSLFARLRGHFQENVARYAVLALAVLTPASGLLGTAAAKLGGADTQAGRIALGAASVVATGIAGITFIRNLGIWQMLDRFGQAPGTPDRIPLQGELAASKLGLAASKLAGESVGSTPVDDLPPLEVPDADSQDLLEPTDGLPSEETPPPDATPPPTTPVVNTPAAPVAPAPAPAPAASEDLGAL